MIVADRQRHTGLYTVRKYAADIDDWYRDPQYLRQARALPVPDLIDLIAVNQHDAARQLIDLRRRPDVIYGLARRHLAAQAFHAANTPFDRVTTDPNVMITKGVTLLWTATTGGGVTPVGGPPPTANALNYLTATTAGIGVGDNTAGGKTTAVASDTDLNAGGATPAVFYILVNAAPSISAGQLTLTCSLSGTQANFTNPIAELVAGNFISATNTSAQTTKLTGTAYSLISHVISALGTKSSGQTWTITFTDTIS